MYGFMLRFQGLSLNFDQVMNLKKNILNADKVKKNLYQFGEWNMIH